MPRRLHAGLPLPLSLTPPAPYFCPVSFHLQRDFSFLFYAFSRILGICVNFIWAATPPSLPISLSRTLSSLSPTLSQRVRVALPFNCFLSHELSFSGRSVFKTYDSDWDSGCASAVCGVINVICSLSHGKGACELPVGKGGVMQLPDMGNKGCHRAALANICHRRLKCAATNAMRRGVKKGINKIE